MVSMFTIFDSIMTLSTFLVTATVAATLDQLGSVLTSDYDSNPPLYITKKRVNHQDQIFINNAMVIRSRSNIVAMNQNNKKQVRACLSISRTHPPAALIFGQFPTSWQCGARQQNVVPAIMTAFQLGPRRTCSKGVARRPIFRVSFWPGPSLTATMSVNSSVRLWTGHVIT